MLNKEQQKLAEELLFQEEKKPSFVKQLFFGKFEASLITPFPHLTLEEEAETTPFLQKAEEVLALIDPVKNDRESTIPKEIIAALGEAGILSCTIPTQYGGKGVSQKVYGKLMEKVAARCMSTSLFVNAHQSIGMRALLLFGTDAQKNKWLPGLASGKVLAAFALTEENAGSDASNVETKALYDAERKGYVITGGKKWITNGSKAGILTVMAKTEDGKITAFLVTPDMPGFKVVTSSLDKLGMRGSTTSILKFEEMFVPEENILGPKGGGLKVALTVLDYGRITFGATCVGVAKELVKMAKQHAETRIQFKRSLASFALVKKKIADMTALTYAMESTTILTAGLLDHEVEDIMLEAAIIKVFNSDALWSIIYDTMQIFGGRSFFTDLPLERIMRDARLNMIGEGSNEVLRVFIAAVGLRDLGMYLKKIKEGNYRDGFNVLLSYIKSPKISFKDFPIESKELRKALLLFYRSSLKALYRYREDIVEKQFILNKLTEAVMALYTASAVISRLQNGDEESKEIGKYYIQLAISNLNLHLKVLNDPLDCEAERVASTLTGSAK